MEQQAPFKAADASEWRREVESNEGDESNGEENKDEDESDESDEGEGNNEGEENKEGDEMTLEHQTAPRVAANSSASQLTAS